MRNTGLEEVQAGIKIAGRNINNLRYADDTTLMAESEGKLKSLLIKVTAISAYSAVRYVPDIRLRSTVTRLISDNQPLDRRSSTARSASVNYFISTFQTLDQRLSAA